MFQKLLEKLLVLYFGTYFQGIDATKLHLGVWSGDILIDALRLNLLKVNQILSKHIPCRVVQSLIGRLQIQIPWASLMTKPLQVRIENVFLCLQVDENMELHENKEQFILSKFLGALNYAKYLHSRSSSDSSSMSSTFIENLTTKIIDNLQITLINLHIRFETSNKFTFGLTLKRIQLFTTNKEGQRVFATRDDSTERIKSIIYKQLNLINLKLYADLNQDSYMSFSEADQYQFFLSRINDDKALFRLDFVAKASQKFNQNNIVTSFSLAVKSLNISLSSQQFQELYKVIQRVGAYKRERKFLSNKQLVAQQCGKYRRYFFQTFNIEVFDEQYELKQTQKEMYFLVPNTIILAWVKQLIRQQIFAERLEKAERQNSRGLLSFFGFNKMVPVSQQQKQQIKKLSDEIVNQIDRTRKSKVLNLTVQVDQFVIKLTLQKVFLEFILSKIKVRVLKEVNQFIIKVKLGILGKATQNNQYNFMQPSVLQVDYLQQQAKTKSTVALDNFQLEVNQEILQKFRLLIPIDDQVKEKFKPKASRILKRGKLFSLDILKNWLQYQAILQDDELKLFYKGKLAYRIYVPNASLQIGSQQGKFFRWFIVTAWGKFAVASNSLQEAMSWRTELTSLALSSLAESQQFQAMQGQLMQHKQQKFFKGSTSLTINKSRVLYRRGDRYLYLLGFSRLTLRSQQQFKDFTREVKIAAFSFKDFLCSYATPTDYQQFITANCSNRVHPQLNHLADDEIAVVMTGLKKVPDNPEATLSVDIKINALKFNFKPDVILFITKSLTFAQASTDYSPQKFPSVLIELINSIKEQAKSKTTKWDQIIQNRSKANFKLQVNIGYLRVNLLSFQNFNNQATLVATGTHIVVENGEDHLHVSGKIGKLTAYQLYCYPQTIVNDKICYLQTKLTPLAITLSDQPVLDLLYFTQPSDCYFNSLLQLRLFGVRLLYYQQPILRIVDYVLYQLLPSLTNPLGLQQFKKKSVGFQTGSKILNVEQIERLLKTELSPESIQIRVQVSAGQLVLPTWSKYSQSLTIKFQRLLLDTQLQDTYDRKQITGYTKKFDKVISDFIDKFVLRTSLLLTNYCLTIQGAVLDTCWQGKINTVSQPLQVKLRISMVVNQDLYCLFPYATFNSTLRIEGLIEQAALTLTQLDYFSIYKMLMHNIVYDDKASKHFTYQYTARSQLKSAGFIFILDIADLRLDLIDSEQHLNRIIFKGFRYKLSQFMQVMSKSFQVLQPKDSEFEKYIALKEMPQKDNSREGCRFSLGILSFNDMMFYFQMKGQADGTSKMKVVLKNLMGEIRMGPLLQIAFWGIPAASCSPPYPPQPLPIMHIEIKLKKSVLMYPSELHQQSLGVSGDLKIIYVRNAFQHFQTLKSTIKGPYTKFGSYMTYIVEASKLQIIKASPEQIRLQQQQILAKSFRLFFKMDNYLKMDRQGNFIYDTVSQLLLQNFSMRLSFKDINDFYALFVPQQQIQSSPPKQTAPSIHELSPQHQYSFMIADIEVMISSFRYLPLFRINLCTKGTFMSLSPRSSLECSLNSSLQFFNEQITTFEPCVESLSVYLKYTSGSSSHFLLEFKEIFNLTLSSQLFTTISNLQSHIQAVTTRTIVQDQSTGFTIVNQVGMILQSSIEGQEIIIPFREQRSLNLQTVNEMHLKAKDRVNFILRYELQEYLKNQDEQPLIHAIINSVDLHAHVDRKETLFRQSIIVRPLQAPLKGLAFHSQYLLSNKTSFDIQLIFSSRRLRLKCGQQMGLPIDLIESPFRISYPHLGQVDSYEFRLKEIKHLYQYQIICSEGSFFTQLALKDGIIKQLSFFSSLILRNLLPCPCKYELLIKTPKTSFKVSGQLDIQESKFLHQFSTNWKVQVRIQLFNKFFSSSAVLQDPALQASEETLVITDQNGLQGKINLTVKRSGAMHKALLYSKAIIVIQTPLQIKFRKIELLFGQNLQTKFIMLGDEDDFYVFLSNQEQAQKITMQGVGDQDLNFYQENPYNLIVSQEVFCVDTDLTQLTRMISVYPKFVCDNLLDSNLQILISQRRISVKSKERQIINFPDGPRIFKLKIQGNWIQSSKLLLEEGSFPLLLFSPGGITKCIKVNCLKKQSTIYLRLIEGQPMIVFRNNLSEDFDLSVFQSKSLAVIEVHKQSQFGWHFPMQQKMVKMNIVFKGKLENRFLMTELEVDLLNEKDRLLFTVVNPSNTQDFYEFYLISSHKSTLQYFDISSVHHVQNEEEKAQLSSLNMAVLVNQLGISLIGGKGNSRRQLSYFYMNKINFLSNSNQVERKSQLKVGFLNLDNNSKQSAQFPVTLTPLYLQSCIQGDKPALFLYLDQSILPQNQSIKEFKICFQPLSLKLTDVYLDKMFQFSSGLSNSQQKKISESKLKELINQNGFKYQLQELKPPQYQQQTLLRLVHIASLQIHISFKFQSNQEADNMKKLLTTFLGVSLISVQDVPIKISKIFMDRPITFSDLWNQFFVKFRESLLKTLLSVLTSFSLVGNPYSFIRYVSKGVYQLVELPVSGFVRGPFQGVFGIGKGIFSFTKNSTAAFFNSFELISDTIANGLVYMSMDKSFKRKREQLKLQRPQNVIAGTVKSFKSIGLASVSAVTGFYRLPKKQTTALGKLKGFSKAMLGLLTKPISGIFDSISEMSKGVKNTVLFFQDGPNEVRRRPCRVFYDEERAVRFYNEKADGSAQVLQQFLEEESHLKILDIIEVGKEHYLILGFSVMALVHLEARTVLWHLHSKSLTQFQNEQGTIRIFKADGSMYVFQVQPVLATKIIFQIRQIKEYLKRNQ